jgi:hypothetical protein
MTPLDVMWVGLVGEPAGDDAVIWPRTAAAPFADAHPCRLVPDPRAVWRANRGVKPAWLSSPSLTSIKAGCALMALDADIISISLRFFFHGTGASILNDGSSRPPTGTCVGA